VTKVLLLRKDEIRHRALASYLHQANLEVYEVVETILSKVSNTRPSKLIEQHFNARRVVEADFFEEVLKGNFPNSKLNSVHLLSCNSVQALEFSRKVAPDFIITFGCSILEGTWISEYPNKILGIHLGLSPYYRGSGTNFFPIVNKELSALGFTLMNLDEGIDTGNIICQGRAEIVIGDGIHTIGTRVMKVMFSEIISILREEKDFSESVVQPKARSGHFYRRKDFNESALRIAINNMNSGLVEEYLSKKSKLDLEFPIVERVKKFAT
jgi:methionyl-tRNA formyltransferase